MMREIKFRQPLLDSQERCYAFHYWGFIGGKYVPPMFPSTTGVKRGEDQEYTGVKDKNGKEIFESDIVIFMVPDCTWSNPQIVQYCHSSFVTKSGNLWGLGFAPDIVHNEDLEFLEVIGNIYENPELLEAKP